MLSDWINYIEPEQFNTLIDFINNTKNNTKWQQKYIYLYGEDKLLNFKLIKDVVDIIGKNNCHHCHSEPFKSLLVKDVEEECEYEPCEANCPSSLTQNSLYIHNKLLIFNQKIFNSSKGCAFIKEILGSDPHVRLIEKGKYDFNFKPTCNVIVDVHKDVFDLLDVGIQRRSVIINVKKLN